jgi:hypothetical protein
VFTWQRQRLSYIIEWFIMIGRSMVDSVPAAREVSQGRQNRKRGEKFLPSEKNIESFLALLDAEGYEQGTDTEIAMTCLPRTKKHFDFHSPIFLNALL